MTQTDWAAFGAVAQAVAAVGTLAAVIVSLYLSRNQNKTRLHVQVRLVGIVTPGVPNSDEGRFLSIKITNAAFRDVVIEAIGWRVGFFRRNYFFQGQLPNAMSARLPAKLAPAESATMLFPWEAYFEGSSNLRSSFGRGLMRTFRARRTKLQIHLSTGETILVRIDPYTADALAREKSDPIDG